MAFVCVGLFISVAVVSAMGIFSDPELSPPLARVIQIVSFHVVAFLVVGLLSARLAERRYSGESLATAAKDLANLKLLHERIIESIRSGLITTDLDGKIYTFNAAASEITGLKAEDMIGTSIHKLFGDISEAISFAFNGPADTEQPPRFEADLLTPEGFVAKIGYSVSLLFSEEHEMSGLIVTFQDLTEIRSMEENVRRKDRLAAVGRVGAGLAHEIRNPLGAMRGAIQVLESTTPKDSIHTDLMEIILRESDRLNSIITNFLSYARPKAGNFTEIDVCEAVRETLKLIRHSPDVTDRHVIETDLPDCPITIEGDSTQLKQIFWNLARNAINAMPEGGTFRIQVEPAPNKRVRITFSDTGHGMSQEKVEQLFEPFSNSTSGGTGLGLSIVYQIIRDHHGTINVRSSEGEGTVITAELPAYSKRPEKTQRSDIHVSENPNSKIQEFLNVNRP
jgi:two-component system sensor histidine kinase PilS (NtrC family)